MTKVIQTRFGKISLAVQGEKPEFASRCGCGECVFHGRFWSRADAKSMDLWISGTDPEEAVAALVDGRVEITFPLLLADAHPRIEDAIDALRFAEELYADGRI